MIPMNKNRNTSKRVQHHEGEENSGSYSAYSLRGLGTNSKKASILFLLIKNLTQKHSQIEKRKLVVPCYAPSNSQAKELLRHDKNRLINTYEVGFSNFLSANGSKSAASGSFVMLYLGRKFI